MAVNSNTAPVQFTANGSQVTWSYNFNITANNDLAVYVDKVRKTITTDYTVNLEAGTVTFLTAPLNGSIVTIDQSMSLTRTTAYSTGGAFNGAVVDADFNRLLLLIHQHQSQLKRVLRIAPGSSHQTESLSLDSLPGERANRLLGFDGSGSPTVFDAILTVDPTTLYLRGSGGNEDDTLALQGAVDLAISSGKLLKLSGDFRVSFQEDPWWFYASVPTRGVHAAIRINGSNLRIQGDGARIFVTPPSFDITTLERFVVFATARNLVPGTLENLSFEGLTFDFIDDFGPLPEVLQAFLIVGCRNVTNQFNTYTSSPRTATVTITRDVSNNAVVTWPGYALMNRKSICRFSGNLPPEIIPVDENYVQRIDANTFNLSAIDTGSLLQISAGTFTCTAHGVNFSGRAFQFDNCDHVVSRNNQYEFLRQGNFVNCIRDFVFENETYHQMSEGIDIDHGADGGRISNLSFSSFFGEAQGLDCSYLRNTVVTGLRGSKIRQIYQLYTKWDAIGDYAELQRASYPFDCSFTAGTPGVINVPIVQLIEGTRFWTEAWPEDQGAYPGSGIAQYTTYFVRNPNNTTGTCNFSATSSGSLIAIGGSAATGTFRAFFGPADPATVLPSENVVVDDVVADFIGGVTDAIDDIGIAEESKDNVRIGFARRETPGVDRQQNFIGVPVTAKNIRLSNHTLRGGNRVHIVEGDGIDISGFRLINHACGNDSLAGAALVLQQSIEDAGSITESVLKCTVRDVEIINSAGMGVRVVMASRFHIDGLKVAGFNLQADDATAFGLNVTHWKHKNANITLGNISISGGVNGGSAAAQDYHLITTDGGSASCVAQFKGPFRAASTAASVRHVWADVGPLIGDRQYFTLPSVDTTSATGAATVRVPLMLNGNLECQALFAAISNLDALSGTSGTNYTSGALRKSSSGTLANVSGSVGLDNSDYTAVHRTDLSVGGMDIPNDTLLTLHDMLFFEFTRQGTGSVTPRLMLELVMMPYSTIA